MFIYYLYLGILLKVLSQENKEIHNKISPISFTLSNNNILIISNSSIHFYNSFFNSSIKSYKLKEFTNFKEKNEAFKIIVHQFLNEYIISIIKNHLNIFSQNGDIILERHLIGEYINFPIYDLIPIKKEKNDLYCIFVLNNFHNITIS